MKCGFLSWRTYSIYLFIHSFNKYLLNTYKGLPILEVRIQQKGDSHLKESIIGGWKWWDDYSVFWLGLWLKCEHRIMEQVTFLEK
jgi:hypothetical protein